MIVHNRSYKVTVSLRNFAATHCVSLRNFATTHSVFLRNFATIAFLKWLWLAWSENVPTLVVPIEKLLRLFMLALVHQTSSLFKIRNIFLVFLF